MNASPIRYAICMTGGIGSGKSTVAGLFAERGAAVIDTDEVAHRLTAPDGAAIPHIREQFGEAFITADGALNRQKMRRHVFEAAENRKKLEAILHPMILEAALSEAAEMTAPYVIFVVPLLTSRSPWIARVKRVLVVDCPETLQISRVMKRSGLTKEEVEAIMAAQLPRSERLKLADDVIENAGAEADLTSKVQRLHDQYQKEALKAVQGLV